MSSLQFGAPSPRFPQAAATSREEYQAYLWDPRHTALRARLKLQEERAGDLCLQCRQEFYSMYELFVHIKDHCWASISEKQYPTEWGPPLMDYVRRALDPVNRKPGWSIAMIIEELEGMIHVNSQLARKLSARWETIELPQNIQQLSANPVQAISITSRATILRTYPALYGARNFDTPEDLFKHENGKPFSAHRNQREILVFTDGSCIRNGLGGAQGGCAFVFRCIDGFPFSQQIPKGAYCMNGTFFFRLEDVGPTDKLAKPTSNRAELRAVVAALRYVRREESGLGFRTPKDQSRLVIATDSTYVVNGATSWIKGWELKGWRTSNGDNVKNRDLWELLLARVRVLQSQYCEAVSIWHIPRELNRDADGLAKYAAKLAPRPVFGIPKGSTVLVDSDYL